MKTRRILSLLLALTMVLTLFTACGEKAPVEEEEDYEEEEITSVSFPLEEPFEIEIMFSGNTDWNTYLPRCSYYQKLVAETNVTVKPVNLGDEPMNALNAKLASGDYGDVIMGGILNDTTVSELAYAGWLLPLEDYLTDAELMPNYVNRGLADVPGAVGVATLPDGHVYSVPRIDNEMVMYMSMPLVINVNWMAQAGLDNVDTIEKFEQYLTYVRDNDVNGNGNPNDEIPLLVGGNSSIHSNSNIQALLQWWDLPTKDSALDSYCTVKDGVVTLVPTTEAYKDAINTLNRWFEEGLIWSECYTANKETFSGRLDSETAIWGAALTRSIPMTREYAKDQLRVVAPPKVEGYDCRLYINPGVLGYKNTFSVTNNCENPEIVMAWLDYMYSEENSVAYLYNLADDEPARYQMVDGKINTEVVAMTEEEYEWITENNPTLAELFGATCYMRTSDMYRNLLPMSDTFAMLWDAYENIYKDYWNDEMWPRPYFTQEASEEVGFLQADIFALINDYEAKWVTGVSDINEDWDTYMAQMEAVNYQRLVELQQEAYDVFLAATAE